MTSASPPPAQWKIRSTQGVELVVHDLGGKGPTLVLAHATGLHGMVWQPLAHELKDRFHCISFDFRGHGKSPMVEGADLAWTSMADDLMAVVDHVSPDEPVRVVGHSMGGAAIAFAASRNHGRFLAAWAFEPILFPDAEGIQDSPLSESAKRRRADFGSRDEAFENYNAKPPLNLLREDALRAYVDHGFDDIDRGVTISCRPATEAQVFQNAACGGDEAALGIDIPFALVAGSDQQGPGDLARAVAPRSDLLTLIEMDLSHFGPLEDPVVVANSIRSWFESLD